MKNIHSIRLVGAVTLAVLWPLSASADNPVNGATLYNANCAGCHGASPQTVDTNKIGNGRNARGVNDAAITLVGAMSSLRATYPSGGSNLADIAAYLGSAPGSLTFASTAVGSTSASQSITLYPSLLSGQSLSGITVSTTGDFARNGGTCGTSLSAGGSSCTLLVQFAPTASGTRNGTLSIQHNNTLTPISIALSGTGGAASGQTPGTLDASFGTGGTAIFNAGSSSNLPKNRAIAMQSDGKILVAGTASGSFTVSRLLANGTLDPTFGCCSGIQFQPLAGGSGNITATSIAVQADGKIVVAGSITRSGSASDFAVARFTANGATDTSFNGVGYVITPISTVTNNGTPEDEAWGVAIQADQKIVVAGTTTLRDSSGNAYRELTVVRYNSEGTPDSSFGPSGIRTLDRSGGFPILGYAVAIQTDGKIVVGGEGGVGFAAVRFHGLAATGTPGTLDTSFNGTGRVYIGASLFCSKCRTDNGARSVAIQSDGKIVLAGYSDNSLNNSDAPNNNTRDMNFAVVRLNANGSADSTFGMAGSGFVITRVGSSLPSPNDRTVPYDQAYGVAVQSDGKIVVVGDSVANNSSTDFALVRYSANGSLDTGFGSGGTGKVVTATSISDGGRALVIQTDGKIVVAGFTTNASNNGPDFAVVRYAGTPPTVAASNPRDFNGDGKSDIMWQNTSGERAIWYMNGGTFVSGTVFNYVDPSWQIAVTADFNGDGKPDIIWQNVNTGERYVWYMNGATLVSAERITILEPAWQIVGAADFNGDGKPDLLWQNTSGRRAIWYMNGITLSGAVDLGYVDPTWQIAATGDFNADGKPDIVFQNTSSGQRALWYMNGATLSSAAIFFNLETAWSIAGAGDFNGDGKPDLLWQNINGDRAVFYMDGANVTGAVGLFNVSPAWSIIR